MTKEVTGARPVAVLMVGAVILVVGVLGMFALTLLYKEPESTDRSERPVRVETMRVAPEDIPVVIRGFGEVKANNLVAISAQVAGRVIERHPKLEVGERIAEGEVMVRIEPLDYQAGLDQARATVAQLENSLRAIRKQFELDQSRAETLRRSRDLAEASFQRVKGLYEGDQVGTLAGVDQAEIAYNQAKGGVEQIEQALDVYPARIEEVASGLEAARAGLRLAEANLSRTELRAPFTGRLTMVQVETGQFVGPGVPLLMLADDSLLKMSVPLDSRDVRQWLRFSDAPAGGDAPWFGGLEGVTCKIVWPEDPDGHFWEGLLARVEIFDPRSRTVTVAVNIPRENALSRDSDQLPLVDGMFCAIEIPGRALQGVYRLPRWAVTFDNKVYVNVGGRLEIREVAVARSEGEEAFVSSGLNAGDEVITTRLINPLPGSLLEIIGMAATGGGDDAAGAGA